MATHFFVLLRIWQTEIEFVCVLDEDAAILHRMVLFLGKLTNKSYQATWTELQEAISAKHPGISKNKLRQIANANKNLFSPASGGVQLGQLNCEFVRGYFELAAEGVEVITHPTEAAYSLSEPCHFQFGASILVTGMVCASSVSLSGRKTVLFKYGGQTAYRLENKLDGIYNSGQRLRSGLRIRKDVARTYCFLFLL